MKFAKLIGIDFYPKRRIKTIPLKFEKVFEESRAGASHSSPSEWYIYSDSFGISYKVSAENTEVGKYFKGDLMSINYDATDSDFE